MVTEIYQGNQYALGMLKTIDERLCTIESNDLIKKQAGRMVALEKQI